MFEQMFAWKVHTHTGMQTNVHESFFSCIKITTHFNGEGVLFVLILNRQICTGFGRIIGTFLFRRLDCIVKLSENLKISQKSHQITQQKIQIPSSNFSSVVLDSIREAIIRHKQACN